MILVRTHDLLRNKHFQAIFSKLMLNCCQAIVIEDGGISIAIRTSTFNQVPDEDQRRGSRQPVKRCDVQFIA